MPHVVAKRGGIWSVVRADFADWVNARQPGTYELHGHYATVEEAFEAKRKLAGEDKAAAQGAPAAEQEKQA